MKRSLALGAILLAVVACGGASPSASGADAPASAKLDENMEAAVAHVKSLITKPDAAEVERSFSPGTLSQKPAAEWVAFFNKVHDVAGTCDRHTVVSTENARRVAFRFACEKRALDVTLGLEDGAAKLLNYCLITAAK